MPTVKKRVQKPKTTRKPALKTTKKPVKRVLLRVVKRKTSKRGVKQNVKQNAKKVSPKVIKRASPTVIQKTVSRTASAAHLAFISPEVTRFVSRYIFVNATFKYLPGNKMLITFTGHQQYPLSRQVPWADIHCRRVSDFLKTSPCTVGTQRPKIFFRHSRTLGEYIRHLNRGVVTRSQHHSLWDAIFGLFPNGFINHNEDVDILHFKQ